MLETRQKKIVITLSIFLALTFFGFIDDKFRGWDDTNQYQLEAKVWARGSKPPVPELAANTAGQKTQFSVRGPVLVPFIWSFLISDSYSNQQNGWASSLIRIKIFQAVLISTSFLMIIYLSGFSWSGLAFAIFLFMNGFFRDFVSQPITEPFSYFILIFSYLICSLKVSSRWRLIVVPCLAAAQCITRTQVGVLHLSSLWKERHSKLAWASGLISITIAIWFFGDLIRGSKVHFYGPQMYGSVFKSYSAILSQTLFIHLFNYEALWFQYLWRFIAGTFLLVIFYTARKNRALLLSLVVYVLIVFSVLPQGLRYFLPMFLLALLEFKPKIPKMKFVRTLAVIFAVHLCFQQIQNVFEFHRFITPETQSPGLVGVKNWIRQNKANVGNVMMLKFRYCINFFEIQCFTVPDILDQKHFIEEVQSKNIRFLILSGVTWQIEEKSLENVARELFKSRHLSFEGATRTFDTVRVIDLKSSHD